MRIKDWDRSLKARLIGEAFMNTTFWMFFPFLAIYFADEFGKTAAGMLMIVSQVFSVAANLVGGYCADRFGRKTMMIFGAAGQGLSFLFFAIGNSPFLESPMLAFIGFTSAGVFGSFYWPASQAVVADLVPEEHRSGVFAVFYTSTNIAVVVGPILGGIFFFQHRFGLLLFGSGVCLLLAWILFKFTKESLAPETMQIMKDKATGWIGAVKSQVNEYGIIMQDKLFMLFILAGILVAQTFMQLDLLVPVYLSEAIDKQSLGSFFGKELIITGEKAFSFIISENGLIVALLTVALTKWMTRYKEKNVFFASSLLYALSMIIFAVFGHFYIYVFAMFIFTLGELIVTGIQQSFISKLAPEDKRGQYFAAASLRYTIGRMIAPISIPMTAWFGFFWTFIIIAFLAILSAILYRAVFTIFEQKNAASSSV